MSQIERIIVTAEHASSRVPRRYAALFTPRGALLTSHRGLDFGARELARRLARALHAELFLGRYTRLLVDLNRSPGRRALFSEVSRSLPADERRRVLERYYLPYRDAVERAVRRAHADRRIVFHLSVHSFTPRWGGKLRRAAVGLLYDPGRPREARLCRAWQESLRRLSPALPVRRNYPYRGVTDGLVTFLRRRLKTRRYVGVELEVNQRHACGDQAEWRRFQRMLVTGLQAALKATGYDAAVATP